MQAISLELTTRDNECVVKHSAVDEIKNTPFKPTIRHENTSFDYARRLRIEIVSLLTRRHVPNATAIRYFTQNISAF